jgi:hypothetical protein
MSTPEHPAPDLRQAAVQPDSVHLDAPSGQVASPAPRLTPRETERHELPRRPLRNTGWLADQHRKQEERRCYVCNGRDDGGCHGMDGERAECPWY